MDRLGGCLDRLQGGDRRGPVRLVAPQGQTGEQEEGRGAPVIGGQTTQTPFVKDTSG